MILKLSGSGKSHVPSQPSSIPSPRGMRSRDSCLPHDTRNSMGNSGNVCESLLARDGPSSAFFDNPKNLASSFCGLRPGNTGNIMKHEEVVRREPQSSTIPAPRFTRNHSTWTPLYHTGGTDSHSGMMDYPRHPQLHLGKFTDSIDLQCWKVNFKTEVCGNTPCPTLTMPWIKEVEIAI